eukprot:CAMPEP_0170496818 /NCGR_PEP_ID=MMETSP0208-20121228/22769_1 /TAXON_ID=197538 /ORGANISM="Strombidium inclinatum, Strain S3" /LENGTH=118 /DNA_ID=CAMNT_0010773449 /DNA_START=80 /DNA_END=436 /DNA_ORIENTATION=-
MAEDLILNFSVGCLSQRPENLAVSAAVEHVNELAGDERLNSGVKSDVGVWVWSSDEVHVPQKVQILNGINLHHSICIVEAMDLRKELHHSLDVASTSTDSHDRNRSKLERHLPEHEGC